MAGEIRVKRLPQAGRLVPCGARTLHSRIVRLKPGGIMDWHSTHGREELLIGLNGRVEVEVRVGVGRTRRLALKKGQSSFLPAQTLHRVVNRSSASARYLYIAG